ncbi:MAG: dTMP kinase [Promethearchaeota archaeon]|nr:MAG: dTMP kinase [Candidatus Lokiarchaeota archaeon]
MVKKGLFCAIDGIDGSGTTTHSELLAGFLKSKNYDVHLTQEPSSSEVGKLLRNYLKDKNIPPTTDALLFAADRDLHYHNEINKKLEEGFIVISDRYIESSIVYQSTQSTDISIEWISTINKFVKYPDITIILDIDPKISLARKAPAHLEKFEDTSFLDKVRSLYLERAKEKGYFVINTDDIIEVVQEKIQNIVSDKLKE